MKPDYRLRKKADFDRVYRMGKTAVTAFFRIKTTPNGLPHTRFAVVIPNKIIKGAVLRNRKKRQTREAVRALYPELHKGYDIVLLAQPPMTSADFVAITEDLRSAFARIHLLG